MKLLLLTTEFGASTGGIARYAEEVARSAAQDLGADVTVVLPDSLRSPEIDASGIRQVTFPAGQISKSRPWRLLPAAAAVRKLVQDEPFDIVHAIDLPSTLVVAYLRQRRVHLPSVFVMVHGTDLMFLTQRAPKAVRRWLYRDVERVLTNSSFTSGILRAAAPGLLPDRIRVTPLGVHPKFFDDSPRTAAPGAPLRVLSVGRLDPRKGHDLTIRAVGALGPGQGALDIVGSSGDAGYDAHLTSVAEDAGTDVTFHRDLDDDALMALYRSSDVFCLPGYPHPRRAEGFGLVYLEAAAAGLPTLASAIDAVPEVVVDGITGLLCPPGSLEGLTDGLARLATDPALRTSLGAAGRERARTYTWERCARWTYA